MENLQIAAILDINEKAVELLALINFLFVLAGDNSFIKDCMGKSTREINNYVSEKRKERIMDTMYPSIDCFLEQYRANKQVALETLFQEPLTHAKVIRIEGIDPIRIFEIHSSKKPNIRCMDLLQFI